MHHSSSHATGVPSSYLSYCETRASAACATCAACATYGGEAGSWCDPGEAAGADGGGAGERYNDGLDNGSRRGCCCRWRASLSSLVSSGQAYTALPAHDPERGTMMTMMTPTAPPAPSATSTSAGASAADSSLPPAVKSAARSAGTGSTRTGARGSPHTTTTAAAAAAAATVPRVHYV